MTDAAFWNARYAEYDLAYGAALDDFLAEQPAIAGRRRRCGSWA